MKKINDFLSTTNVLKTRNKKMNLKASSPMSRPNTVVTQHRETGDKEIPRQYENNLQNSLQGERDWINEEVAGNGLPSVYI